jgi:hypothetical protein
MQIFCFANLRRFQKLRNFVRTKEGRTFALPLRLSYSLEFPTAFATLIKMWIFGEFGLSHTVYNLSTAFTYESVFRFDSLNINADFLHRGCTLDIVAIGTIYLFGKCLPFFAVIHATFASVQDFMNDSIFKVNEFHAFRYQYRRNLYHVEVATLTTLSPPFLCTVIDSDGNDSAVLDSD